MSECYLDDEEPDKLDNRFELETNGTNYCRNIWREIAEDRTDSFWRAVANQKLSESTGAQVLAKWRICPFVEPHPQILPKHRFAKIDELISQLNEEDYMTEGDVAKLTDLIYAALPSEFKERENLRVKESLSSYINALVRLKYARKDKWTETDWTTAIYASLQNFFWSFENRSNSDINSDHFPPWITPIIKPDFCSSNERPFLVAEYGVKKKSATHKDLFKLLQTMRSMIRRWQLDFPKRSVFGPIFGILIGADTVTVFQMEYDIVHDVYNCCVFLEEDARCTFTLALSAQDIYASLNSVFSIMLSVLLQVPWGKKTAPQSSSNKSHSRVSDNSRIHSSTSDTSVGEVAQRTASMELSENREDDGDNDQNKNNKKAKKHTATTNAKPTIAPKGTATNVNTKKKQIQIEQLYTVNDPEMLLRSIGMFLVLAQLTKHARKVVRYNGSGEKYLAKLDLRDSPIEVKVLKRLGSDNKKFIHPWVTELIDGVHITLFEWKENKIHEARSNISQVRRIAKQVLEALADMHAVGLCHGDVKFDNVIDTGVQAYLVDFNLSYEPKVYQPTSRGTTGYRAPEVVKRKFYSEKADIYAFGIFVIEVLIGKPIYSFTNEKDELKIIEWIKSKLVTLVKDEKLLKFISKCLEEDEGARPTAIEMLQDKFLCDLTQNKDATVTSRKPLEDVTNKVA